MLTLRARRTDTTTGGRVGLMLAGLETPPQVRTCPIFFELDGAWRGDPLPFLTYIKTHAGVHIRDGRAHPSDPLRVTYRAPADAVYLYCSERPQASHAIARHLRESHGVALEDAALQSILDRFVARGFMLSEDNLFLSLGLPAYRRA